MSYPSNNNKGAKNLVDFINALVRHEKDHSVDANGHTVATQDASGFMSAEDKRNLDTMGENLSQTIADVKTASSAIDSLEKMVANLQALLKGDLYQEATDATEAYSKAVGDSVMPYAGIRSVGGKTLVWNQQFFTPTGTDTTFSNSEPAGFVDLYLHSSEDKSPPTIGHIYLFLSFVEATGFENVIVSGTDFSVNASTQTRIDSNINAESVTAALKSGARTKLYWLAKLGGEKYYEGQDYCYIRCWNTENFVGTVKRTAFCFDLTLMFGAGNEPATVEEFEAMFPAGYYDYNAGELLSAGVTQVQSLDNSGNPIAALTIPSAVQALPSYGWSVGTARNWIDFENRVYHREVAGVDLGTIEWSYDAAIPRFRYNNFSVLYNAKKPSLEYEKANIVCSKYTTTGNSEIQTRDKSVAIYSEYGWLNIRDDAYTSAYSFKNAMSGVMLYYELAEPELIDISDILPADNGIKVESGGQLIFKNQNGDDYRIPVPSEIAFMTKTQTA